MQGNILDLACGIGYGSQILSRMSQFTQYTGVDISEEAYNYASKNFTAKNINFLRGNALDVPLEENSFDRIISFETLEHIEEFQDVIKRFSKLLKIDGILIGSVPSEHFEDLCTSTYGPNPYHLIKFSKEKISKALHSNFKFVEMFSNELRIGSFFKNLNKQALNQVDYEHDDLFKTIDGSIYFFASNSELNIDQANKFYPSMSIVEYDSVTSKPLRQTIFDQEKLIIARDEAIKNQDKLVRERDEYILKLEKIINAKK